VAKAALFKRVTPILFAVQRSSQKLEEKQWLEYYFLASSAGSDVRRGLATYTATSRKVFIMLFSSSAILKESLKGFETKRR
jgi:hypothetical protein